MLFKNDENTQMFAMHDENETARPSDWYYSMQKDKPVIEFELWLEKRAQRKNDGTARCNACARGQTETRNKSLRDAANSVKATHNDGQNA